MTTLDDVLDWYPEIPRFGRVVERMAGGSNTAPWSIVGKRGRYVLRRLPNYLGPQRARFAATVHDHAAHKMDVVPAVVPNGDGDLITEHADHRYLLVRYAPGNPLPQTAPTSALCRQIGGVLGRLHQRLRGVAPTSGAPRQCLPSGLVTGLDAAIAAHDRPGCLHMTARKILAVKQRRAEALRVDDLSVLRALPVTLVHGDFHAGNVLTVDGQVTAVLDFDLVRLAPPAYELVRALLYTTCPAGPARVYAPRVTAFLDGYLTAAPLTRHELSTMTDLFETTQILDPYGFAVCTDVPLDLLAFGHARFSLLYWLRNNNQALTNLALRAHEKLTAQGILCSDAAKLDKHPR